MLKLTRSTWASKSRCTGCRLRGTSGGMLTRQATARPSGVARIQPSTGCAGAAPVSGCTTLKSVTRCAPCHSAGSMRPSISTACTGTVSTANRTRTSRRQRERFWIRRICIDSWMRTAWHAATSRTVSSPSARADWHKSCKPNPETGHPVLLEGRLATRCVAGVPAQAGGEMPEPVTARGGALFLRLQHRSGAVFGSALAGPELLDLGRMRFVQDDAVVVGQLFAGLDVAHGLDIALVLARTALAVLFDLRL